MTNIKNLINLKTLAFLLIFSLLTASNLYAEMAIVSGRITDTKGNSVDDVVVSIGKKFDFTDIQGRYRIKNVPYGEQKIQIKRNRKVIKEINIKVNESRITQDVKIE